VSVLKGVRVLEVAGIGPGPFCGMLLADLGADVIVIERAHGPQSARPRPAQIVRRGKRSIVLDLKAPGAIDAVLRLVERSDALIEGMRPGAMERIGLGPDVCFARRPSLVYGRMTGWGQEGPMSQIAGHDSNYTALAGALWFASPPGQPPVMPATLMGDVGGGALYLAIGLLAGILRARADGTGQVIDAAMVDGTAHMMNLLLGMLASQGNGYARGEAGSEGSHWAGRSYRCADGKWVNIASLEPQFYSELLARLGLEGDARFVRGQWDRALWPELARELTALFATRTRDEWTGVFAGSDACFAPVLDPAEAAAHPHLAGRGTYRTVDGVLQAAPAPRFSRTPSAEPARVADAGAHTREVLAEAGLAPEQIDALVGTGAAE
jgi:crotonobetainyl-CoA:carnitine CoA-transferase CaiB-like acyl-CoA transferase